MKHTSIIVTVIAFILVSCGGSKQPTTQPSTPTTPATGPADPAQTFIREDIYSLASDDPIVVSYKNGISAMRARSATDPTSWSYQAAIHGTYATPARVLWDQCQHGSFYFLAWHRMYLYYFERIVRAASNDPTWSLPYWNYSDDPDKRRLPEVFRQPTSGNPLYNPERNPSINLGSRLNASDVSYSIAFQRTNFVSSQGSGLSFGGQRLSAPSHFNGPHGRLENQPHDLVHVGIGGWMGDPNTAAQDPIFWLHHANIDRLWEQWLALGNGRTNPTNDQVWMTTLFEFFNESGNRVTLTGADILNTVTQLGYKYDDQPESSSLIAMESANDGSNESETFEAMQQGAKKIYEENVNQEVSEQLTTLSIGAVPQPTDELILESVEGTEYVLYLEGITYDEPPTGSFEVYINLPQEITEPEYESIYYVGNIGLFGFMNTDEGTESEGGIVSLEIGEAVKNLLEKEQISSDEISVTIYRRPLEEPPVDEDGQVEAILEEPLKGSINIKSIRVDKL